MAEFQSPGGFVFGVQGWEWGEQRPKAITFFLDGTAKVCDQHGRPIKGTVVDGKVLVFSESTHAETIEALRKERVDWTELTCAGWPQIPYKQLMEIDELPPTPLEELRKIKNPELRRDAMRARREADAVKAKELQTAEDE